MAAIAEQEIRTWQTKFCRRFKCAPPEFWDARGWHDFRDIYEQDIFDTPNPIHANWFDRLITEASVLDLDQLTQILDPDVETSFALLRFFQYTLVERAWAADQAGQPVSVSIPLYFRGEGWELGPQWNCEKRAPPPPTVEQLEARLLTLSCPTMAQ
jgi:hypothetical protein